MRLVRLLALAALVCLAALPAAPQAAQSNTVTMTGRILDPYGRPLRKQIRLTVAPVNATQPPETFFSDNQGQFALERLRQRQQYEVFIEGDGELYADTRVSIVPIGPHPTTVINLRGIERPRPRPEEAPSQPAVSVATLANTVPEEARRHYEAGMRLVEASKHAEAQKELERAVELYPDYVDALTQLGSLLLREEKTLADAERHLRHAAETDPQAAPPQLALGLCLYRQKRFADAIPPLERGLQLQPGHPQGQALLGISLAETGQDDRAVGYLERAYELGGESVAETQFHLARLLLRKNEYARAAAALENFLKDRPNDPSAPRLRETLEQLRASLARPQP
jgi:tetratricopeptide (TPR) repeat protein